MKNYIDYNNSLNVLNEGFFSWVWKLTKLMFKKVLAAQNFSDLNDNISKLEKIIKYGAKNDGNPAIVESLKINEGRTRSRARKVFEEGEDNAQIIDTSEPTSMEPAKIIPKDQINMNIPSYRQTCITMLNGLEDELKVARKNISSKVLDNWNNALSAGKYLHSNDAQYVQLLVTDFIRKYSAGQIAPPTLNGKDLLTNNELQQWNALLKKSEKGDSNTAFKSVENALKKVLDNYNENFKETLNDIINNAKGEENSNTKMILENKLKIQTKWDGIYQRCENFISTAIADYFVNDDIYKSALDFIKELLVILTKNSEIVNRSSKSEIGRLINLDDEDKAELIENVAEKYNLLRSNIEKFNNGKQNDNDKINPENYKEIDTDALRKYFNDIIDKVSKIYKNNKNVKSNEILEYFNANIEETTKLYPIMFYLIIKTLDKSNMIKYYLTDRNNNKIDITDFLK